MSDWDSADWDSDSASNTAKSVSQSLFDPLLEPHHGQQHLVHTAYNGLQDRGAHNSQVRPTPQARGESLNLEQPVALRRGGATRPQTLRPPNSSLGTLPHSSTSSSYIQDGARAVGPHTWGLSGVGDRITPSVTEELRRAIGTSKHIMDSPSSQVCAHESHLV